MAEISVFEGIEGIDVIYEGDPVYVVAKDIYYAYFSSLRNYWISDYLKNFRRSLSRSIPETGSTIYLQSRIILNPSPPVDK